MCCLFGMINYHHTLPEKQKKRILAYLSAACEARGTDATGIAYNAGGKLCIYKRPWPAHFMHFHVPRESAVVMGHTRMTTQGAASRNRNNHPFPGKAAETSFALAHNGIIYNDDTLRSTLSLPATKIETDSYIAVQLLERKNALNFSSLRSMAEQLRGSFTITVLDGHNNLYIVKGDNPMCLYHYPALGLYLYASTEEILKQALQRSGLQLGKAETVPLGCGEILKIHPSGKMERSQFDAQYFSLGLSLYHWPCTVQPQIVPAMDDTYLSELKSVAMTFGYTPEEIDHLIDLGFDAGEIEEFLYCGSPQRIRQGGYDLWEETNWI